MNIEVGEFLAEAGAACARVESAAACRRDIEQNWRMRLQDVRRDCLATDDAVSGAHGTREWTHKRGKHANDRSPAGVRPFVRAQIKERI